MKSTKYWHTDQNTEFPITKTRQKTCQIGDFIIPENECKMLKASQVSQPYKTVENYLQCNCNNVTSHYSSSLNKPDKYLGWNMKSVRSLKTFRGQYCEN